MDFLRPQDEVLARRAKMIGTYDFRALLTVRAVHVQPRRLFEPPMCWTDDGHLGVDAIILVDKAVVVPVSMSLLASEQEFVEGQLPGHSPVYLPQMNKRSL